MMHLELLDKLVQLSMRGNRVNRKEPTAGKRLGHEEDSCHILGKRLAVILHVK